MGISWIKASRPLNVLIIGLIQFLLYYKLFWADQVVTQLDAYQVSILIIVTCLITMGGYYINDYFDQNTDLVNQKPHKHRLTQSQLWVGYLTLSVVGFGLAVFLANQLDKLAYSVLYLLAVLLLYYYSAKAKGQGLLGNVIVSLFCTGGLLIILLAEWDTFVELQVSEPSTYLSKLTLLIGFSCFAGLITLIRELVKDIEDIEGDRQAGIQTFVVKHGTKKAKLLSVSYSVLTTLIAGAWSVMSFYLYTTSAFVCFVTTIIPILVVLCYLLLKAKHKADYHKISQGFKVAMICSLLYLILT